MALQRLQDVIRRKDSVFFILSNGSDALSKLLSPLVKAQDVLQRSSNIVERGCMVMGYTGWLYINPSTLCKSQYSIAAWFAAHQRGTREILVWNDDVHKMSVQSSVAVEKDLTPILSWFYGDKSISEVTRLTKEVISPIQTDVVIYALLYGVVGLQWTQSPMIINNASFSFSKQEILWDTMSFASHVENQLLLPRFYS